MQKQRENTPGLSGNQLKIIALVAMTCDHVGLQLLPQIGLLRIIGRLALPIYAYMIAEGCRYTRDRRRYLGRMLALAAVCQAVYFGAMRSLYQCILVTFSLSICLIFVLDRAVRTRKTASILLALAVFTAVFSVCVALPERLFYTDFAVDYGIWGVLLPVFVYFGRSKNAKLAWLSAGLCLLAVDLGGSQWGALAAVPLLALYSGRRGTWRMGSLFYVYYPVHLAVIYGLSLLLG